MTEKETKQTTEVVRKAVELADGWTCVAYAGSDLAYLDSINGACWRAHNDEEWTLDELPQIILDALAAQLERQFILADPDRPVFLYVEYCRRLRQQSIGRDLTMWRIRYFVDSGVLETAVQGQQNDE